MWEALIIFAAISVLLAFIAWPEFSLCLLAAAVPIIGWNFNIQSFVLPLTDIVAILAFTAFVVRRAYSALFSSAGHLPPIKWPLFLPFSLLILISFFSALWSSDPAYSLWYLFRWLVVLYFAYIFLPYNLITDGRRLKKAIFALIASSVVVLLNGYLSLLGQDWRDHFFRLNSPSWFGIFPFGDNHNLIAEFLNVGAFLMLAGREIIKDERMKKILGLSFLVTVLGIILTFSRTGWITLFLQVAVYFLYKSEPRNRLKIIFAGLGIFLLLTPLTLKMLDLQEQNVSSTEDRWLLTEISWEALKNRPILGYGPGQFINLVADNVRFRAKYGDPIDSHGIFQKVIAENGIFGLGALLFLLVYLLKVSYQALHRYYAENKWLLPLTLAAAGGLFFQIFNTSYYKGKVWLPIAILLAAIRLLEKKHGSRR